MEKLEDQDARMRIAQETDRLTVVEAAAGTGKTTVMVERMLSLMKKGVRPANIAAITFTEKAAAELALRVRTELEKAVKEGKGNPKERKHLEDALSEFDRARISTIHSFAFDMVKELPVEANMDPAAEVMDELDASLDFEESWKSWLGRLAEEDWELLETAQELGIGLEKLKTAAKTLMENRDVLPLLKNQPPPSGAVEKSVDLWRQLEQEAFSAWEQCRKAIKNEDDLGYEALIIYIDKIEKIKRELKEPDNPNEIAKAVALEKLQDSIKPGAGNQNNYQPKTALAQIKKSLKNQEEIAKKIEAAFRESFAFRLSGLLCRFVEENWEQRRRRGKINFQDILILARDMLKNSKTARRHFQKKYQYLLVDEFQDTDPLQVEIINLLFDNKQRKQKLFLVGDPKQSIYRFRRADIAIYNHTLNKLGGNKEILSTNFRSLPEIIGLVNGLFKEIFEESEKESSDQAKYQADYVALVPFRKPQRPKHGSRLPPQVSVLHPSESDYLPGEKVDECRKREAEYLAALVEHLVDPENKYKVHEKVDGREKLVPLSYRHIAILFPKRSGLGAQWLEPFMRRGIPFVSDLEEKLLSRSSVVPLKFALRAIDRPSDTLSLFAALRSPLFGFSDEELLEAVKSPDGGRRGLDYRIEQTGNPRLDRAYQLLRRLHFLRNRRPLVDTINELIRETGYELTLLQDRRDDILLRELNAFMETVRNYQALPGAGFSRFAADLSLLAELQDRESGMIAVEPDEDLLVFSTIHGAKGLEFPVVILANLNDHDSSSYPELVADRINGKAAVIFKKDFATPGADKLMEEEKTHQKMEKIRLFYVAATRARDALVFSVFTFKNPANRGDKQSGNQNKGVSSFLSMLPEFMKTWDKNNLGRKKLGVYFWNPYELNLWPKETVKRKPKPYKAVEPNLEEFEERRKKLIAQAAGKLTIRTPTREKNEVMEKAPKTLKSRPQDENAELYSMGLALHAVMEKIPLDMTEPEPGLIEETAVAHNLQHRREELEKLVRTCLLSGPVRKAAKSGEYHREVPYHVFIDGELHEGRMDLVFREGDKVVIVDYKTDRLSAKEADEAPGQKPYQVQARAYKRAAAQAMGVSEGKVEVWFVFARPGKAVKMA